MFAIKIILILLSFILPFFVGILLKRESVPETYLFGQILAWAIFQLMAVPMILLHVPFMGLFIPYTIIVIGLGIWGIIKLSKKESKIKYDIKDFNYYLIPALLVIAFQAGMYFFGQHLDEDDARWIAEASDAIAKNKMLLHNAATGEYIGTFKGEMVKDVFSPWSMYIATISQATFIRPATMAHTFYPPVLLSLVYVAYYLMGKNLFEKKFEQGAFLLMVSIIMMFFSGNRYTQAMFTLTRIWQGKAMVAGLVIPLFLLVLLQIEKEDTKGNWFLLIISSITGCLFSGMGIAISFILAAVYGLYALVFKRFKRIGFYLAALFFPALYGLLSYWLFKI